MTDSGIRLIDKATKNNIATSDKLVVVYNAANTTTAQTSLVTVNTFISTIINGANGTLTIGSNTVTVTNGLITAIT